MTDGEYIHTNCNVMSKSKLRSKYIRSLYKGRSLFTSKMNDPARNPHRQDEMPKNKPSRLVTIHCSSKMVDWLQDSTSFGGHSRPKGGHRRVSGLVRASLKRETCKLIHLEIEDDEQH